MKTKTKIGIGFVLTGVALQVASVIQSNGLELNVAGAGIFMFGVLIEIIGYIFDEPQNKKEK